MNKKDFSGQQVYELVCSHIREKKSITSISGITYKARVNNSTIYYQGGSRSGGNEETMIKVDFIKAFEAVKWLDIINTNTIKDVVPSSVYRKRTPFIAMLLSSGII